MCSCLAIMYCNVDVWKCRCAYLGNGVHSIRSFADTLQHCLKWGIENNFHVGVTIVKYPGKWMNEPRYGLPQPPEKSIIHLRMAKANDLLYENFHGIGDGDTLAHYTPLLPKNCTSLSESWLLESEHYILIWDCKRPIYPSLRGRQSTRRGTPYTLLFYTVM